MTKTLTTRVPVDIAKRIEKAADYLHTEKATLLRTLIVKGLTEIEKNTVIEQYKQGEISFGKMTELLGITIWDGFDLLQQYKIHFNYGEAELKEDIEPLTK